MSAAPTPSLSALVLDLCGEEPDRPALREALARCPRNAVAPATHRGQDVVVARLADGTAVAFPDICPHDGGLLSDGFVDGDVIVCSRHGWEFDGCSGRCTSRPHIRLDRLR